MPISVTLKLGALEVNYPLQNTDSSGNVQVSTSGLPAGGYAWRAKGPRNLATSGFVDITPNVCVVTVDMGLMKAGDANNDNVVSILDFNIFKATNGKGCGDIGYDGRADFNNDCVVNVLDFNLLKSNLGQTGAPSVRPSGKTK